MSNPNFWQCHSVKEFFSTCNWQGQPLEKPDWQNQNQSQIKWQCRSVKEFFSTCNWQGQALEKRNQHQLTSSSLLILQVKEFCKFIPWEGNPEIGSLPKTLSTAELPFTTSVQTTLTDLSELF